MKITINQFVLRQTSDSQYSHYEHGWESLCALVVANFDKAEPGYREGVVLVPVPAEGFMSAVVDLGKAMVADLDGTLRAEFIERQPGETAHLKVTTCAPKQPARVVKVVCYSHDTLGGEASSDAPWEVVSINAGMVDDEPMTPMAMARNFLELPGGTKAEYTAEEFARAILFWSQHAMAAPPLVKSTA